MKLIVPPEAFAGIRKDLNMFNVNAASVFPDLDGLCSHLSWRYTALEDETRAVETGDAGRRGADV